MRIINIENEPFHKIKYRSSGRNGVARKCTLPFHKVRVEGLPKGVQAVMATADLQGREMGGNNRLLGEVVADELDLLQKSGEIPYISLVILAGDLYDYPDLRKLGGTGDVTSVWNAFASKFSNCVGVHGNHDMVDAPLLDSNIEILDGTSINIKGLTIGGVSGIIGTPNRNQRKTEEDFVVALSKVTTMRNNIVVLHQGPDHPTESLKGDPVTRDILERLGNGLVIFGHCYWPKPFALLGNNQVLNVDSRVFVFTEQ